MPEFRRIETKEVGNITIIQFVERKILDSTSIQEMGDELFSLLDGTENVRLLLNFSAVEFLSSAALNKLIILDKKVKGAAGQLKIAHLCPEIREVFAITRLNLLFDIKEDEAEALAAFE